jgi:hypothetical protein
MSTEHGDSVRDEIYSKAIRAGKRTYFFDVKSTRGNDLYLTITESKKRFHDNGKVSYEKHKIFLYKEDFEKFLEGLHETIDKIKDIRSGDNEFIDPANRQEDQEQEGQTTETFTDISFEDLDRD